MSRRYFSFVALALVAVFATGCPKGKSEFKQGQQAELQKDYDTALIHYERAMKADPKNQQYQLRATRIRFDASQMHVDRGHKLRDQGLLEPAAAEFEKALAIDPSSFIAEQELRRTLDLIAAQRQAQAQADRAQEQQREQLPAQLENVPAGPPELKPLSREPLNLHLTEDAKVVFETIGRLGGINVIFDPEFQSRKVTVDLDRATVEQALDVTSLMTKSFWKTVTANTIMVIPDTAAKRRSYEEQVIKTFYLTNTVEAAQLNEVVQTLRTLLDIKRITPSTTTNAIIIRDTPDKVAVAEKIIRDIDQAKPEVVVQVGVLQARRDRARDLGILPSSSVPLLFTPRSGISTSISSGSGTGTSTTTTSTVPLSNLHRISSGDYSLILPNATAMALLTDATTKVIQNPEVRVTDGETAKLRIGDKVPFAVGSFQPGIGGVGVNPLVNTQFQFQDVGVNLDITPHVHSDREISLQVKVEVSSVTGHVNIGGIDQPIFGQRTVEHEIRLREGEVSILGGIMENTETKSISGWPGLSQIPFLRYLFSQEHNESVENEVLIVLTPRLVRLPEITAENLRPLAVGTDENITLPRPEGPVGVAPPQTEAPPETAPSTTTPPAAAPTPSPAGPPVTTPPATTPSAPAPAQATPPPSATTPSPSQGAAAPVTGPEIHFEPAEATIKVGQQLAVNVVVRNAHDLFSVPFALGYDPKVLELLDVHHGGFLGGQETPAALVHRVDAEQGRAIISLSRAPGAPGASGGGTLVTLVFRGVAAGNTAVAIQNIAARNSQQAVLSFELGAAQITVQ